jgi:hypothetical protein
MGGLVPERRPVLLFNLVNIHTSAVAPVWEA